MKKESEQLACRGGTPVFPEGAPQWPLDDADVWAALQACYASGDWGRYHGERCEALCEYLRQRHQTEHVMLCCSGTIAVELALRGVNVQPGEEVILAAYDFPGNFRAIEAIGAIPVLVDIKPSTWCIEEADIQSAISDKTRAIVVSHLHGGLAAMPEIMAIAEANHLSVVEDACQSPGAIVAGRQAGTWGDVGVFSFGGSKLLTAGRGGALLTRRDDVRQRIKVFSERGNDAFAISELQAAVLLPQWQALDQRNSTRAAAIETLVGATRHLGNLLPVENRQGEEASYYKFAWRYVSAEADRIDQELLNPENQADNSLAARQQFIDAIQAEGVAIDAGFRGFAQRTARRCRQAGLLEHSRRAAQQTLILHHPILLQPRQTILRLKAAIEKVAQALERLQH